MSNDYLWDGSGEIDPEVQKLESKLAGLRHHGPAPAFPAFSRPAKPARPFLLRPLWLPWLGAGIFATGLIFVLVLALPRWKAGGVAPTGWDVTSVAGVPRIEGKKLTPSQSRNLGLGQLLETDSASKAAIAIADTGAIEVDPGARVRLLQSASGRRRLVLERGTIHATIWAPPGEFVVDTPSALAVDLGCVYTLQVDDSGDGTLRTTVGWVGFRLGDREAFVPAGAACHTRKLTGPGTPYFEDASPGFRSALAALDREGAGDDPRALETVLAQARKRDALTLWHLLARVAPADRSRVFDRLAQFVPAPPGVTREGILRLDRGMLDLWWNELGFGDVALWRHWERSWSQQK
jgi:FecR-like protein